MWPELDKWAKYITIWWWSVELILCCPFLFYYKDLEESKPFALKIAWWISNWNVFRYVPEGNMTACGTDYLTKDWVSRSYILVYSVWVYFAPLLTIIYSYWFIVKVIRTQTIFMSSFREAFKEKHQNYSINI